MKKFLSAFIAFLFLYNICLPVNAIGKTNAFMKITKNKNHLHSRLSKRYNGYVYEIKNISEHPITIKTISLKDNINSDSAYRSVRRTSIGASVSTLAVGTAFALPTLSLSLIGSVIAVPFIVAGNAIGNAGARQESRRYDCSDFAENKIEPNESLNFKTIAPHREAPDIDIVYINPITKNIEVYSYK